MDRLGVVVGRSGLGSTLPAERQQTAIIPITEANNLPALFARLTDRDIPDRVVSFRTVSGDVEVLRRELEPAERSALERRASELRSALAPAPASSRDRVLDALLGVLPQGLDYETSIGTATSYLETLGAKPAWAIVKACLMIRGGGAKISEGQTLEQFINATVRGLLVQYQKQLDQAEGILAAKLDASPPPPKGQPKPVPHPPSGRLAPITPWRDNGHAQRVAADMAARKARNDGGEAAP